MSLRHPQREPTLPMLTNQSLVGRTPKSRVPECQSSGVPHLLVTLRLRVPAMLLVRARVIQKCRVDLNLRFACTEVCEWLSGECCALLWQASCSLSLLQLAYAVSRWIAVETKERRLGQNHNVGKDNSIIVAGRSSEQTVVKKQVRTNGKMAAQPCRDGARIACKVGA